MRKFEPLRDDLIKHLSIGIILSIGFCMLFDGIEVFPPAITMCITNLVVLSIAYAEELRQSFTQNRTPAHDDALITLAGSVVGTTLYGLSYAIA